MLVAITGLGSLWRHRFRDNADDPHRFAYGAYYNTTGVLVGDQLRQRPRIVGYARFNETSGFSPNCPSRMLGRVFECADVCVWQGANKILFRRLLPRPQTPEMFLVVVRPELTGTITLQDGWRSPETWLLSFSEDRNQQEAMLLMSEQSWIRTSLGTFVLEPTPTPAKPTLRLHTRVDTGK